MLDHVRQRTLWITFLNPVIRVARIAPHLQIAAHALFWHPRHTAAAVDAANGSANACTEACRALTSVRGRGRDGHHVGNLPCP